MSNRVHIALILQFCAVADRNRLELAELSALCPISRNLRNHVIKQLYLRCFCAVYRSDA